MIAALIGLGIAACATIAVWLFSATTPKEREHAYPRTFVFKVPVGYARLLTPGTVLLIEDELVRIERIDGERIEAVTL